MHKNTLVSGGLAFLIVLPVSAGAADWDSVKEKARALGDETIDRVSH